MYNLYPHIAGFHEEYWEDLVLDILQVINSKRRDKLLEVAVVLGSWEIRQEIDNDILEKIRNETQ
jgi:hypothetical protein